MNRQEQLAISMARKSVSKFRLGAVLAKRKRIISAGFNNMRKTHPFHKDEYSLGLHAEIHACIGVSADELEGSSIYVARLLRDDSLALAKPCKVCLRFLLSVGISRVFYSTNEGGFVEL
jgi:deoxycytidylate deaminase